MMLGMVVRMGLGPEKNVEFVCDGFHDDIFLGVNV